MFDFRNAYDCILDESDYPYPYDYPFSSDNAIAPITQAQWSSLVTVCRTILENQDRFSMRGWHEPRECGTCHCIAGFAQAIHVGDLNFHFGGDTFVIATELLSKWVKPFFFFIRDEELVLKYLIRPVVAQAEREGMVEVALPQPALP